MYTVSHLFKPKVEAAGASVFVDAGEIQYGDDFRNTILDELERCDELLILLTRSSIRRPWVFAELGAALIRKIRIIAVVYAVSEEELRSEGVLSLLGSNNLLPIEKFDQYIDQLTQRVARGRYV